MSLVRKSNRYSDDKPLKQLPEMPSLPSLTAADRALLSEFWRQVRVVLEREDQVLRDLADGNQVNTTQTTTTESQGSSVSISGGVTRDEVDQIVYDSVSVAIANARYTHSQGVPSSEWTIVHKLGWKPSTTVIDSVGNEVCGDVKHDSTTQLRISFTNAFSGNAYLT